MRHSNSRMGALAMVVGLILVLSSAGVSSAAPTIDGNLEADYSSPTSLTYTRDQGGLFTGQVAIIEAPDAYYIGFQQSFTTKSNAYCERPNAVPGCYQNFKHLVSSDYISFEWSIDGRTIYVPVDTLIQDPSSPSGYTSKAGGVDGGPISGIDPSAVTGKSSMDYNLNVLDWDNLDRSPNFAGSNHPFIYASIAEVRLDKSLGGLASGLDLSQNLVVVAHNSPEAPFETPAQHISISCPGGQETSDISDTITLTVATVADGDPAAGVPILVLIDGVGSVTSVGGTSGNRGLTDADGEAEVILASTVSGTSVVKAVWDLDNDGTWDQGTEPATVPSCPIQWTGGSTPVFDLSIVKDVDRATASPSDVLTYDVEVKNTGTGTLTNLTITDPIPAGTTYVTGTASDSGVFNPTTNTLTWTFASLAPGAIADVTFQVTVNEDAPTDILNVAVARANEAGPKQDDAPTIITRPTPPTFDLSIVKDVDRATASPSDVLTYEVKVENTGTGTLTNLRITDAIPNGTTYVLGSASNSGVFDSSTNSLTWRIASLGTDGIAEVTFQVTVNDDAPTDILNVAVALANEAGPKQDDAPTRITPPPAFDVSILKDVDKATASPTDTLTYDIRVRNTGAGTLTNLTITDAIPGGTTYVTGSATALGVFDPSTNGLTWRIASLAPDATAEVSFQVAVNADAPVQILNVAIVRSDQTGPKQDDAPTLVTRRRATVLGVEIARPPVTPAPVAGQPLARTGVENVPMLIVGLAFLGLGFALTSTRIELNQRA